MYAKLHSTGFMLQLHKLDNESSAALEMFISTPQAQFFTLDIKNFHLNMPLDRPEYMCMHLDIMSP